MSHSSLYTVVMSLVMLCSLHDFCFWHVYNWFSCSAAHCGCSQP
ncbi:Core-2/I-branching beta-16-N-acetylglucosaminyltransferase family protein [Zea mays]|uniref:Core-2/I-branching beta-16-N-acetylglucosaminyltransferase family protein n=1 Tax=Zea mays TaxID=4577 RepID=A0A1D6LQ85_MAIZE|nr:Core-2/I-branching beta-16-N-acetylglucosaminyltransferase family protein [Zea mays]